MENSNNEYWVSADRALMQIDVIHDFLSRQSHWAIDIPLETVKRSIENSLNFAVFHHQKQVGYARIITDYATTAYLADVFVLTEYRGKGLSKLLMKHIMTHPDLQGLRRWILVTKDAHGLYAQFGWTPVERPERWMEVLKQNIYINKI